jgi:hypothetical protein
MLPMVERQIFVLCAHALQILMIFDRSVNIWVRVKLVARMLYCVVFEKHCLRCFRICPSPTAHPFVKLAPFV